MGKRAKKRPPPSYEEGKLRDPSIAKMQQGSKKEQRGLLQRLIRRAAAR